MIPFRNIIMNAFFLLGYDWILVLELGGAK